MYKKAEDSIINFMSKNLTKTKEIKDTIIEVKDLHKSFGEFEAVKGISFNVYENEIFGFLGPNGAGKSTTLEIMETLKEKTSGDVVIGGYSISQQNDIQQIKSLIGVQLQSAGFHDRLTLVQIIDLFAGLYNVTIDSLSLLDKVQLRDKAKSKVRELSGGQRQRFSLATTLLHQPAVIFLDEPTTGLDPQSRRNLWELVKNIKKEGGTVVITTHFMDEAEFLCDRVAIIDEGKILKIATPDQLIDELVKTGFKKEKQTKEATLEDVFINLTGKHLRD